MVNQKFTYTTHEDEIFLRIVKNPEHSELTKLEFDKVYNRYFNAYATHKDYKDLAPEWHYFYAEKRTWKYFFGKEAKLPWPIPEVVEPMGYHMTHMNTSSASGSGPSQPQGKDDKETKVDTHQNQLAASPTVRMTLTPDEVQMVLDYREKKMKQEVE